MRSLTLAEAHERSALIDVVSYAVHLDLDRGSEVFGSVAKIHFTCDTPGADSWVDLRAREVASIRLNGRDLDPATVVDGRLPLPALAAENEVVVDAVMGYSHDGQGLHRATDPADGQDYVYGHLFLAAAPRVFACFDQPDLKAPYDVTVRTPRQWSVIGNGAATETAPGEWVLATTKPLATYFVTVCAGPWASVRDEHDGIPLGIHSRQSLRKPLERHATEIFAVTRQSFDYFHSLFDIRYPFGAYEQVFVPEFNAGAMENPGCVVLRDQYIYRGAATRDELLTRANTIAHELSHMWFGDLVTMKWWDDLWLNESFAEYMSHRCLVDATEYTDAWVDSSIVRKVWGYGAERSPSTHPVAGVEALDAMSALQNFDGISYAKGAAALRQLIAYAGDDRFIAGVRSYLSVNAYGNGTLADFLAAIQLGSGKDLDAWAKAWLLTAGRDTIAVDLSVQDLRVVAARMTREAPMAFPADRPHALDVAGWTDGEQTARVMATITTAQTSLDGLVGTPAPAVLVPNAADLTWARVVLSDATISALPAQLGQVPDAQARAVLWSALVDGVHTAAMPPSLVLDVFEAAWAGEPNSSIQTRAAAYAEQVVIGVFLPRGERAVARSRLAAVGVSLLESAEAGSTASLAAARLVAGTSDDQDLLRGWATGHGLPAGLEDDGDFRWIVVRKLACRGALSDGDIERFRETDDTLQGSLNALMCRASRPDPQAKVWAWEQLTGRHGRSNYEMNHLARGFWSAPDDELVEPYVARYFADVPAMSAWVGEDAVAQVVTLAFPQVHTARTARLSAATLGREDLTPAVRRSLVDADHELREVLASRDAFRTSGRGC
ncbi:MAG: aminopeptidase N [Intrasporangium sp.]|uniref:aminopeptidase N n=1 Tax=Intrasporangium sp. TaxID=1925024 RepID=UPI00264A0BDD|nr:aminopeptidase N [Intrasporangium sp.]MDN5794621.1 aminopeptidase N [Intrasporangium sp.]